jgi:hypothetical protein
VGKIAGWLRKAHRLQQGDFTHPAPPRFAHLTLLPLLDAWIGIAAQKAVAYPAHERPI